MFPASAREMSKPRSTRPRAAYKKWRLTPAPKRAEILFRAAEILVGRKEDFAREMTREMGKVLAETRGDVQEAIDMTYLMAGEGPPPVRPYRAVRAAEQIRDGGARADRRRRHDHAVEFSDGHSVVEGHAGADLRQHGRAETRRGHAAFDLQPGAGSDGSRRAAGSVERGVRGWAPRRAHRCSVIPMSIW